MFYSNVVGVGFPPGPFESGNTRVGAIARYGFVLPFYSWFSVYPRMSFAFSRATIDVVSGASEATTKSNIFTASIFVPAMVHLATHFFVGLGPEVSEDIVHTQEATSTASRAGPQTRRTSYGAGTLLGGWL